MRRWLALFLALVLTFSLFPTAFAVQPQSAEVYDVWEEISRIEDRADSKTRANSVEQRIEAYNGVIDEIIEAVVSAPTYVSGSLSRNGNFFFWMDTNGDPNGYSPSYRAKRRAGAVPGADPMDFAVTEIVNYGAKGGSAASMDVAAFQPYIGIDGSFTAQYENRCNAIAQATGGTGTTYKTNNANINNLGLALSTCGVVIFDSHGTTDYSGYGGDYTSRANDSYLCLTTSTGITTQDKASAQGEFGTYYHAFSLGGGDWAVDGTAIANHMTSNAPNSMVWMAICLGMATDGMEAPFRSHGVEVVYGYSQSVTFSGDYKYDGFFWPYMCQDHTVAEACAYMKQQAGCNWDPAYSGYSYSSAVANHVAFPIVASSEDPYPGHGNVDVIQVPNSTWTLFTQFNISAVSNNNAWGTVSVSGRQITATPATGYEVVGYEVLEGTCEVIRNGNIFQVNAETDCTVQINFAARVPATVTFEVPEGVSVENFTGYVGDSFSLPAPIGEPAADAYHYRFLGWVEEPLSEDSMEMPIFQKAGTQYTVSAPQATYYALYKYFVAEDGVSEGQFTLVTQAPASWAGDYVITYQGTKVLDASGTITGASIGGSAAAHDLADIGGTLEGNVLYNIPDEYIYTVEPAGNGAYSLKMKEAEVYLAMTSNANQLMTAASAGNKKAQWNISYASDGVQIANAEFTTRSMRYNDKAKLFRCYASGQQPISLYTAGNGTVWFTTNPRNKTECENHTFGEWTQTVAPTCTASGMEKRVCTVCGYAEYHDLDPLGHDYTAGEPVAPTCTEQGYTPFTCTRCGDSYNDNLVDALGHDYQDSVTEPTCTEGGCTTHTCSRCQDTYTDTETDPLGHDFGEWTVTTPPTCTQPGEETRTCSRCNAAETQPVDELGHDFGEWTVTTPPTCTQPGEETRTCSRCDAAETRPAEAVGHDYAAVVTEPTCVEQGYTTYTCTRCGDSYVDDYTDKIDHTWDEGTVTVVPTAEQDGVKTFTCTCCGEKKTEPVPFRFDDVRDESAYYFVPVYWALRHDPQITQGATDNLFIPENNCTRAQVVTFLWRAAGQPEPDAAVAQSCPFTDVDPNGYYYKAMLWAAEKNITSGTGDTTFSPNDSCTRAQVVTFLWRAAGEPKAAADNPFTDVNPTDYFYDAVLWALSAEITSGMTDTTFAPKIVCTRGQVVTFLYRAESVK